MIVTSFDLSSACIGVVAARINDKTKEIEMIKSCPIVPNKPCPEKELGYLLSKKKLITKSGLILNTYAKPGEETITKKEKERRDREVRNKKNNMIISNISRKMGALISTVNPDLIIVEQNSAFNGILTTVLLAEVMGTLTVIAGMQGIPLKKYPVLKVRKILDMPKITKELTDSLTDDELKAVPDVTKRAIGKYLSKLYDIEFDTDDESDACAVFHYWYQKEFLKK